MSDKADKIPVSEMYGPVLQGEGPLIGVPTLFVRTGGCDYRCIACDSMFSVDSAHPDWSPIWYTPNELVANIGIYVARDKCRWVTLSGGNPLIHQELEEVVDRLRRHMLLSIAVETQGSIFREWCARTDVLVISPKAPGMGEEYNEWKFFNFLEQFREEKLKETKRRYNLHSTKAYVKIVVFSKEDIEFALDIFDSVDEKYRRDSWYTGRMFLSLGNPYLAEGSGSEGEDLYVTDARLVNYRARESELIKVLGKNDRKPYDISFLPQMHVIAHGNKRRK